MAREVRGQTPWQTVGPFFHYCLPWKGGADLVGQSSAGARLDLIPPGHDQLTQSGTHGAVAGPVIEITGRITDAEGAAVPDALLEIWQANAAGRYNAPQDTRAEFKLDEAFLGFGRSSTDADGVYRFKTIRPGRVPGPGNTLQAPHIAVSVLGRGILKRLVTRIYLTDAPENDEDPILALVPKARRGTLIAAKTGPGAYKFDIVLQGPNETVFFEF